uniref:PREDICTED: mitochondrial inner membrane protease subunit 1like putative n=1 Tax=Albugo laibachii Nc14 TaxID=890382 RepID=F0WTD4_9STRA|nr:PREDICTED: mitochondrial inner membrane protease subunit 1like putative [Albugo laibachii Nc14]|eukprot:CCA24624.1 PREDICTED: mitochondrial inner membrane protease subunit 1like putative [Albugo laibachii Nc14]
MEPELPNGCLILIDRMPRSFRQYRRGDVVLLGSPCKNRGETMCKRILAIEGDAVKINRVKQPESVQVTVPKGHVWVEGDNSFVSVDSRHFGSVPKALIRGRVLFVIYPFSLFHRVN